MGGNSLLTWWRGPLSGELGLPTGLYRGCYDGDELGAAMDTLDTDGDGVWELAVGAGMGNTVWWLPGLEPTWPSRP